ncbi:hypothetical protein Taro_008785 [Colocasia esculenta]|uniref:Ion transport domain-containing protein n=1 Tax=Colocasia esculenta TaxID=4460 RepID=A0A843TUP4_COLES|nr:hypothetical protein [Colocasia esculenta]
MAPAPSWGTLLDCWWSPSTAQWERSKGLLTPAACSTTSSAIDLPCAVLSSAPPRFPSLSLSLSLSCKGIYQEEEKRSWRLRPPWQGKERGCGGRQGKLGDERSKKGVTFVLLLKRVGPVPAVADSLLLPGAFRPWPGDSTRFFAVVVLSSVAPMFSSRIEDEMELKKERTVRFYADEKQNTSRRGYQFPKSGEYNLGRVSSGSTGSSKVFPEDHEPWRKRILDPGSEMMLKWNWIFLLMCLVALFIDPFYFYLPSNLSIIVTLFRSIADVFYILHIAIKFRTAYVAPSSRVFGRGELVMDHMKIARRYLRSDFAIDLMAALPLPQIVIWLIIPAVRNSNADHSNNALALIVVLQYFPRLYLIFPLSHQIIKATGVVTKTAWAGAAYNLLLYMLASHVLGASWYLLSIERQTT